MGSGEVVCPLGEMVGGLDRVLGKDVDLIAHRKEGNTLANHQFCIKVRESSRNNCDIIINLKTEKTGLAPSYSCFVWV